MSNAAAIARQAVRQTTDCLRTAIVLTCASALILAGEVLPL